MEDIVAHSPPPPPGYVPTLNVDVGGIYPPFLWRIIERRDLFEENAISIGKFWLIDGDGRDTWEYDENVERFHWNEGLNTLRVTDYAF